MADAGIDLTALKVGDRLPTVTHGPLRRGDLALFAGGSHDHMFLHIDSDFAKAAGMEDVFAQGMLSMAFLAQVFTDVMPQSHLKTWSVRFLAITPLFATVTCKGEVTEVFEEASQRYARIKVSAEVDKGVRTIVGDAVVLIS
jgi:acyl dehydratase